MKMWWALLGASWGTEWWERWKLGELDENKFRRQKQKRSPNPSPNPIGKKIWGFLKAFSLAA
jgi:hypothetical protein